MATVTVEEMVEAINNADDQVSELGRNWKPITLDAVDFKVCAKRLRAARDYILSAQSQLAERDAQIAEMRRVTGPKCPRCGHFAIEHEVRENTMRRARQFCKRCACDTDPLERWTEVKDGE